MCFSPFDVPLKPAQEGHLPKKCMPIWLVNMLVEKHLIFGRHRGLGGGRGSPPNLPLPCSCCFFLEGTFFGVWFAGKPKGNLRTVIILKICQFCHICWATNEYICFVWVYQPKTLATKRLRGVPTRSLYCLRGASAALKRVTARIRSEYHGRKPTLLGCSKPLPLANVRMATS